MEIYWEVITLIVGFLVGYIFYDKFQYRAGGVLVIPLMSIYFIKYPIMIVFTIISTYLTYITLNWLYNKFFIYGRRLLYLALGLGLFINLGLEYLFSSFYVGLEWFTLLTSGLLAYNFHREYNSKNNFKVSMLLTFVYFIVLIIVGVISIWLI